MQGSYKHRAYPFEPEPIRTSAKKKKKKFQHREFRKKEKIQVRKVFDLGEDFVEPDVGYDYEL